MVVFVDQRSWTAASFTVCFLSRACFSFSAWWCNLKLSFFATSKAEVEAWFFFFYPPVRRFRLMFRLCFYHLINATFCKKVCRVEKPRTYVFIWQICCRDLLTECRHLAVKNSFKSVSKALPPQRWVITAYCLCCTYVRLAIPPCVLKLRLLLVKPWGDKALASICIYIGRFFF